MPRAYSTGAPRRLPDLPNARIACEEAEAPIRITPGRGSEFPEDAFAALRRSPEAFAAELQLAAAIHWFQQSVVSQGRAALLAGLPRMEFLDLLARRGLEVVHVDMDELRRDVESDS